MPKSSMTKKEKPKAKDKKKPVSPVGGGQGGFLINGTVNGTGRA